MASMEKQRSVEEIREEERIAERNKILKGILEQANLA
jgi:hypothetical protein